MCLWAVFYIPNTPLYCTGQMAMNEDLLKLGSDAFYLRGTERLPTTIVGLSFFPEI